MQAVEKALAGRPEPGPLEITLPLDALRVEETAKEIAHLVSQQGGRLPFQPLLIACQSRTDIVLLFLAVLELIKQGSLWAHQEAPFGEITLVDEASNLKE